VAVGHKLRALANKPVRIEENGMEVLVRLVRLPVTIRDRGHLWELQRMDGAEKEGDLDIQEDPSEWEDPTDWNDEFPPIKPERPGSSFLKSPPGVVFHGVVKNADVDEW
jgi:hypothetical protein